MGNPSTLHLDTPSEYRTVWKSLLRDGYAVVPEDILGFDGEFRSYLLRRYFDAGILESSPTETPRDRERARDVVVYEWVGDDVRLAEHDSTVIENRDGRRGKREYARVYFLEDPMCARWVSSVLALVPPELQSRQRKGTFGINLFRTHSQVVSRPHSDDEEYILIYVVDKMGNGAETQLYDRKGDELALSVILEPGNLLIFKDELFLHNTTPLGRAGDQPARRDALVCTVNYPETYPLD